MQDRDVSSPLRQHSGLTTDGGEGGVVLSSLLIEQPRAGLQVVMIPSTPLEGRRISMGKTASERKIQRLLTAGLLILAASLATFPAFGQSSAKQTQMSS